MTPSPSEHTIVILGSGIIGLSTAYYLLTNPQQPPSKIHIVDPSPVLFSSASGYAAGFIARDWFVPEVAELGELSFREHEKLARREGGREMWGWCMGRGVSLGAVGVGDVVVDGRKRGDEWLRGEGSRAAVCKGVVEGDGNLPRWLRCGEGIAAQLISEEDSTAQVDPFRLCNFLLQKCLFLGMHLHHPSHCTSISLSPLGTLSSAQILNTSTQTLTHIPCTQLLLACGAWTPLVLRSLFPSTSLDLPITSLAGYSLVVRSEDYWGEGDEMEGCCAVFASEEEEEGGVAYSPEVFSRLGGEIYVAGLNEEGLELPGLATDARGMIDEDMIERLMGTARKIVRCGKEEGEGELEVARKGLCFRPMTERGTPILGRIPNGELGLKVMGDGEEMSSVWVAAGHGPWGISLSLGTGLVMAEMMMGRKTSADVSGLGL